MRGNDRPNSLSVLTATANVMTRDTHRVHDDRDTLSDAGIYAALWATAPFSRLPEDAPEGLRRVTVEIDDPKRIYGIYKARRRHNFQLLVERYDSTVASLEATPRIYFNTETLVDTSSKYDMAASRRPAQLQHVFLVANVLRMAPQSAGTTLPAPGRWRYTWPAKIILNWVSVITTAQDDCLQMHQNLPNRNQTRGAN